MTASKPFRILIVDDDEDDYFIVSDLISLIPNGNYSIDWAYRYDQALEWMTTQDYDLYFVDYRMGARSGMELLKEAIQNGCEAPIILLTGGSSRKTEFEAIQSGAVDYLIKADVTSEKLERTIRYAQERTNFVKALRANERKYRAIFEKSRDIVFLADEDLRLADINPVGAEVLEYPREVLLSQSLYDLMGDASEREILAESIRSRAEVRDVQVTLSTGSGDKRVFLLAMSPPEGGPAEDDAYWQAMMHDITNLRRAEKATLQAEKLAATGRLVRTLAHEVRNPLNNITLSVEQILAENPDENTNMYLQIVQRNSKRISDLITELLNSSRPSELVFQKVPLQTVIDEVIAQASDRIQLRNIRLTLEYPQQQALPVEADVEKLTIALLNIVINATEAMEKVPDPQLRIQLSKQEEHALLLIADNGCGIPEENISKLFEPYFTQKRNGMGLGLASTLNIVRAHKGSIEVHSEPGKGTTFEVKIPLTTAESEIQPLEKV